MNEAPLLLLMALAGALLAVVYLAGLWLTLRNIHRQQHPALWLVGSIVLRMALVIGAFFLILGERHWQLLLAALAGFVALRAFTIQWMRRLMNDAQGDKGDAA